MNILVVGGAGYVGSHSVRFLLEAGHDVVVYDNLSQGHRRAIPSGLLIEGELADRARLVSVLRDHKVEAVMHFAALSSVPASLNDPSRYYRNNVTATLELLDAMRDAQVFKIVFSSTTAIYSEPKDGEAIAEKASQNPTSPYGFTKVVIERILADYAAAYGLSYAVLRYFNAAGAAPDSTMGEDHVPETHLIPLVLGVALGARDRVTIHGDDYPTRDGTCIRDYVHVDDIADAHLRALTRLQPRNGFQLNLGSGSGTTVREIIQACRDVTGHPIPTLVGPRRAGDAATWVADTRLAEKRLGWTRRYTSVRAIIETAWKWHSSHPRGYAL